MHNALGSILPALVPLTTLLWLRLTELPGGLGGGDWHESYDYVIVGGGSAGAVLANRLSENPKTQVLLLEAGGNENLFSDIPAVAPALQKSRMDWQYFTEPQPGILQSLKYQQSFWPRGKVLGGCSVLNYMLYVRGNKRDYDRWAKTGATGWSYADNLPYFIKSQDQTDKVLAKSQYHGTKGYLTVSTVPTPRDVSHAFPLAAKELGYHVGDYNGKIASSFSIAQTTTRNGSRCSTAKAFLKPVAHRPNLNIVTHAFVHKILFKGNTAIGVQFEWQDDKLPHKVFVKREVIISAGAVNSPQLLMLSGIGPRQHLEELGIPVVADLPGVGQNLQDHIFPEINFSMDRVGTTSLYRQLTIENLINYLAYGRGDLTSPGLVDGLGFFQTDFVDDTDWPDMQIHFLPASAASDQGILMKKNFGYTDQHFNAVYKPYFISDTYSMNPVMLRPKSVGYIKLRSADPHDHPIINPRYFSHPDDVKMMVDGMKKTIQIGLAGPFKKYGAKLFQTKVPECIQFEFLSDDYFECWAKAASLTLYHPVGTCKMGPIEDPTTVVDTQLRVKNVLGLRVVDASVMPYIVSGNTNAPTIMIGERGADFIKGVKPLPPFEPSHLKDISNEEWAGFEEGYKARRKRSPLWS